MIETDLCYDHFLWKPVDLSQILRSKCAVLILQRILRHTKTGAELVEEHSDVAHSAEAEGHCEEQDEEERHLPEDDGEVDVVAGVLLEHVRLQLGQVPRHGELYARNKPHILVG